MESYINYSPNFNLNLQNHPILNAYYRVSEMTAKIRDPRTSLR